MLALSFLDSITTLPAPLRKSDSERGFSALAARIKSLDDTALATAMEGVLAHPHGRGLLECIFSHSPFLSRLVVQHADLFAALCARGADALFADMKSSLEAYAPSSASDIMKTLRVAKGKASLVIAVADIAGIWPLERVTLAMSEIAELCVQRVLGFLLKQAAAKGDIALPLPSHPEQKSGLFVLAMGKLGARELNYSSDIDLIVFFDNERVNYTGTQNSQQCFSKLTQEMVRLLQERTADGYVFRVDLRLRPDPASTPAAMSIAGALTYYETVGQNWERAAFIKARPIAGDMEAGHQFLNQVAPFIWRKHLDFAAIADIQSIKRQMDAKTGESMQLPGHNIKTGIGGIREIEFFAQIHQLIWGGRMPALRVSATCRTLELLAEIELIEPNVATKLIGSYHFLRMVEHRLQMVDDAQTHSIPAANEARAQLAAFAGFDTMKSFEETLLAHLEFVHTNFSESFRGSSSLGSDEGKLSFTGVENDPQTLETIHKMGYQNPASVSELIQGWHRGSRRATRTKRARELITELTPTLLKALAATPHPDQAFIHFDEFLSKLPAGVQLFSLFYANPHLLDLVAVIMGSAPAMAESLSKTPNLLDAVLTAEFSEVFADTDLLFTELSNLLLPARDFEDEMDIIRRFKNEKQFQAGVQLILHRASADKASHFLTAIAETCLKALLYRVEVEFTRKHAKLKAGHLSIVALGRLGAHELTFGSDIDLVFIYDSTANDLYNKLSMRFIGAVTALTREGRLYEVDTRLRPSGMDGALAVSVGAFDKYFRESAWTFEFMALTRARVISGSDEVRHKLDEVIRKQLLHSRPKETLVHDVQEVRGKVAKEFGTPNPWNLKYTRGGLMDLNFLAQYFILLHGHRFPDLISPSTGQVFMALGRHGLIDQKAADELARAHEFLNGLFALLRLCGGGTLDEKAAPQGFKLLIAKSLQLDGFEAVKATLLATLAAVAKYFDTYVKL